MVKTIIVQLTEEERDVIVAALEKYKFWAYTVGDNAHGISELISEIEDLKSK